MGMIFDDSPCSLCGLPFGDQDTIDFTYIGTQNPLLHRVDDWAVHRSCLEAFPKREKLIEAWNAEAGPCLGRRWMLKITDEGEVTRLSWWDWQLFRFGFKSRLTRG